MIVRLEDVLDWREYTAADFGLTFSLVDADGRLPKFLVLKEAGDLLAYRRDTRAPNDREARFVHGLQAGYPHYGPVCAIDAAQTAPFVAYW